jgi:hypothetical protein
VVHDAVGSADFLYNRMSEPSNLTGLKLEMTDGGAGVSATGYFGVTIPAETELSDFNLVHEWPPLLNTDTGEPQRYGEFLALVRNARPHLAAKLRSEHAKRAAAQQKRHQQHQAQQHNHPQALASNHKVGTAKLAHNGQQFAFGHIVLHPKRASVPKANTTMPVHRPVH